MTEALEESRPFPPVPRPLLLLADEANIPAHLVGRAAVMHVIALHPHELYSLEGGELDLSFDEERLIDLLATGATMRTIATRLNLSLRTVQRKVATLRDRLGARSTAELITRLVRGRDQT